MSRVLATLKGLLLLCQRQCERATKYLLPYNDGRVTAVLVRAQAEANGRKDKGFDVNKNMSICESHGIP